jgi:hypothetical protein
MKFTATRQKGAVGTPIKSFPPSNRDAGEGIRKANGLFQG